MSAIGLVKKVTSSLARVSAHRPIHVILITALLASIGYLSVVDEYVPETFKNHESGVHYYHAPGSSDYQDWKRISDISTYPDANLVSVVPLRFRRFHDSIIPEVEGTYNGLSSNERILIVESDKLDSKLQSIDKLSSGRGTWKARHNNKVTRYYDYGRQSFSKLQSLIQGAESFDIILITSAYVAMWYTLIKVFYDMRVLGSKFWLAFLTIISSSFAFLFALVFSTKVLDCKVPFLSITEGIPFLVAIIGFKHKVSIATYVINLASSSTTVAPLEVKSIVADAISAHTVSLLRDHLVVVGALLSISIYAPHLVGLTNFCILSALILTFDLLLVYTFFSAVLALKVEINRARRTEDLKLVLQEDGVSSFVAAKVAKQNEKIEHPHERNIFTGNYGTSIVSFKVATIAGFFAFHAFWLGLSWLYNTNADKDAAANAMFTITPIFSKAAAKHIKVGSRGTIVTILPPKVYLLMGLLVQLEDFVLLILEQVSHAIRDNLISKFLLFCFAISISTNAYFLNASRRQVSANNILMKNEIASAARLEKVRKASAKVSANISVSTASSSNSDDESIELEIIANNLLSVDDCVAVLKEGNVKSLKDDEVLSLVVAGKLPLYALEKQLGDNTRAVLVRRKAMAKIANAPVLDTNRLPYKHYDYDRIFGACCENVIGYMPLPVGVAGPLIIDNKSYHIPMATTEGCLVASTMRGCKAINAGGGVETVLTQDGMTRGPCVLFPSLSRAGGCKIWLDSEEGQKTIKKAFNSTSRFARLQHIKTALAGTTLFIRFTTTTGDAMGMNMISKGVEFSLKYMIQEAGWFDMSVISVSGNYCTDKKPAAINWIEGRGKSIVAEARIPADVVRKVLKSDVDALIQLNISKNLVGSAMAGSVGGFNAHAANLVTAVFLACGQDPAQNVESSNCITLMHKSEEGHLVISVSMPSIEVGTIGGGTILEPQAAMLEMLGVRGPHPTQPGENARQLAKIVASAVLAAELSLLSALAAGHLVELHMQLNRKAPDATSVAAAAAPAVSATVAKAAPVVSTQKAVKKDGALADADLNRLKEGSVICIKS